MVSCVFMWWVRDKIIWRGAHKFFQLLRSCLQEPWFYSGISTRNAQYNHVLLALITGGEVRWERYTMCPYGPSDAWNIATLPWEGSLLADENLPCFKGPLLFSITREHRPARLGWGEKPDIHNTKSVPPRHTHFANPRHRNLVGSEDACLAPCKQPLGCPFNLQFRWQQEGYWHQPRAPAPK